MAAIKVRNLWTAFITAFFALLASVGLTTASTAARRPAVRTPEALDLPKQARRHIVRPTVPAPSTGWSPTARDRSLPPTIKQRIRAEAHGSSPASRHLPAIDADSADLADFDPSSASAHGANTALAPA
ncbi:DUF6344 domain-containing protein [Streptomyces sp. NPDC005408]|uniref:DUF6344 domain-containing protein n=1 Tax=Streptomyces sp. NPDC005408 TaxID=3155341 RepID=UPI0033BC9318